MKTWRQWLLLHLLSKGFELIMFLFSGGIVESNIWGGGRVSFLNIHGAGLLIGAWQWRRPHEPYKMGPYLEDRPS